MSRGLDGAAVREMGTMCCRSFQESVRPPGVGWPANLTRPRAVLTAAGRLRAF